MMWFENIRSLYRWVFLFPLFFSFSLKIYYSKQVDIFEQEKLTSGWLWGLSILKVYVDEFFSFALVFISFSFKLYYSKQVNIFNK
jgi:hypothetical protein